MSLADSHRRRGRPRVVSPEDERLERRRVSERLQMANVGRHTLTSKLQEQREENRLSAAGSMTGKVQKSGCKDWLLNGNMLPPYIRRRQMM